MGSPGEWENVEQAAMEAQIEPQPAPPPRTGLVDLSYAELEALRGLLLAEADLARRKHEVYQEILHASRGVPDGAILTRFDPATGTGTWEVKA